MGAPEGGRREHLCLKAGGAMTAGHDPWFVDSDVLLYRYDAAHTSKQIASRRWLDELGDAGLACLSWQVLPRKRWVAAIC